MKLRNAIAAVAFALTSIPALADTVTISFINGLWFNPSPPVPNVTIVPGAGSGPTTVSWGTPFPPNTAQSSYVFDPIENPGVTFTVNPPPSSPPAFLGEFIHNNFPITSPFLTAVSLQVQANVTVNGISQGLFTFLFDFAHNETPNNATPCAFGGANGQGVNINGCADKVTLTANAASQTFLVSGVQYTLNILGFAPTTACNGVANEFLTTENLSNRAFLCANVAAVTQRVPEPSSLALVGLALLGAGFMRRKTIG